MLASFVPADLVIVALREIVANSWLLAWLPMSAFKIISLTSKTTVSILANHPIHQIIVSAASDHEYKKERMKVDN
jgi:Flp pilus assembly protein TadB